MPLNRFRIRTLMIAVAVVAFDLAILAYRDPWTGRRSSGDRVQDWLPSRLFVCGMIALWLGDKQIERSL